MASRRLIGSLVVGILAGALLYLCGYSQFHPLRARLVLAPIAAVDGQVRAGALSDPDIESLRAPFAIVARIDTSADGSFQVTRNRRVVCAVPVRRGSHRVDCADELTVARGNAEFVVTGPRGDAWSLTYFEVATHHGGSRGAIDFNIVPAHSPAATRPSWLAIVAAMMLGAAIGLVSPSTGWPPPARWAFRVFSGLTGAALVAILALPFVTPYSVIISQGTFIMWGLLLGAPRLWTVLRHIEQRTAGARVAIVHVISRPRVAVPLVGLCSALMFWTAMHRQAERFNGNDSAIIQIGRDFVERNPLLSSRDDITRTLVIDSPGGYDGQFMYAAAFDPFMRMFAHDPARYGDVVDAPVYRYGRMGFSTLTYLLSLGDWRRFPTTMVWLILGGICLSTLALASLAVAEHRRAAAGLLVVLIPGFWWSSLTALPEPIAAAFLLCGYLAVRKRWFWAAGAAFAASFLVRETGIIFFACVLWQLWRGGDRRAALRLTAVALVPLAAWRLYVASVLFPVLHFEAFFHNPHDLGVPFVGFVDLWRTVAASAYYNGSADMARSAMVYPVLLTAGFLLSATLAWKRPSALSVAALAYSAIGISLGYEKIWVHVGNGQRGTYEMFVMLALCTVAMKDRPISPWWFRGFWGLSSIYVFYGAFNAEFIRASILSLAGMP